MTINDQAQAETTLLQWNYFRFCGYARVFEERNGTGKPSGKYRPGTQFENVCKIYLFDDRLRTILFDFLGTIEVAFRTALCYEASCRLKDSMWHRNAVNFKRLDRFEAFQSECDQAIGYAGPSETLSTFQREHGESTPPCWMMTELLTWGDWSKAYANLADVEIKRAVSSHMGCPYQETEGWIFSLKTLRNECAHQGRIWNSILPTKPRPLGDWGPLISDGRKVYVRILIMLHILGKLGMRDSLQSQLDDIFSGLSEGALKLMGKA